MSRDSILILASNEGSRLHKILIGMGVVPLMCTSIQGIVNKVRHEQVLAVVFDRDETDVDVLELILNIRDVDGDLPVVIVARPSDLRNCQTVLSMAGVHIIDKGGITQDMVKHWGG